ncbi:NUDIX domain-containing protein [Geomonas sp. RF6]|uniref:ADP-ribose pyrophosphatase n=1 Tax=Geomonas sp. RF6 TaxID=2897342 RepID=UPI001E2C4569|nr:NUDIX domain-containing protein [Geomonas sp. RF6]UFS71169.1 NUDIX domain-containing protein [Geomonas sp. RF6]
MASHAFIHTKARFEKPAEYPERFPVPDHLVSWGSEYPEYAPPYYVSPVVIKNDSSANPAGWADPEDVSLLSEMPQQSFAGVLVHDAEGRALNPIGRTGIAGRGLLGKWGPNYAADPIITCINHGDHTVEMLAVQRKDNGQWAIPGGMVDKGEEITKTLTRELMEETGVRLDMGSGSLIYRGYVDDPRNTDHAWMETTAKHLHLDPETARRLDLVAGSDARAVRWFKLTPESVSQLYASHCALVKATLEELCREGKACVTKEEREIVERLLQRL